MADLSKIVDYLSKLTVIEAAELSKLLEEKWGVSAAAAVAVAAGPAAGAAAPAEEQTEFTVILKSSGDKALAEPGVRAVENASPLPVPSGELFDKFRTFKLRNRPEDLRL